MYVELEERVARLERQNRHLRICGCSTLMLLFGFICAAVAPLDQQEVLMVKELRLTDSDGKTRATFRLGKDNSPALALLNADGKASVLLSANADDTAGLVMGNRKGERVVLGTAAAGPGLLVQSGTKESTLLAGLIEGDAAVVATGEKGSSVIRAMKTGPALGVVDPQEKMRAGIGLTNGQPRVFVLDQAEVPIWKAPSK